MIYLYHGSNVVIEQVDLPSLAQTRTSVVAFICRKVGIRLGAWESLKR